MVAWSAAQHRVEWWPVTGCARGGFCREGPVRWWREDGEDAVGVVCSVWCRWHQLCGGSYSGKVDQEQLGRGTN